MKLNQAKIIECAEWVAENGLSEYGGASINDLCSRVGINKQTYFNWLKNSTFSTAIEKAKQAYKDNLEHGIVDSLINAARGYEYEKTKTELGTNKNGEVVIKKKSVEKVKVAPNVGAAVFLLTNIAGETWKNKQNTEVSANIHGEVKMESDYNLDDIPEDMLFALADKMQDAQQKRIDEKKNGKKATDSINNQD